MSKTVVKKSISGADAKSEGPAKLILVVDDEVAVLRAVERTLKRRGYEVLVAEDGDTAYEMCVQRKPDVVVTDINMPLVSGTHFVALLHLMLGEDAPPVIAMTGSRSADIEDAVCLLLKPQGLRELPEVIDALLAT